jgi:hypothetical protein
MPMYLVVNPGEELAVMREEVFGPITPIKTYSSVEEAYDYIAGRERPLASYLVTAARNEADVESLVAPAAVASAVMQARRASSITAMPRRCSTARRITPSRSPSVYPTVRSPRQ